MKSFINSRVFFFYFWGIFSFFFSFIFCECFLNMIYSCRVGWLALNYVTNFLELFFFDCLCVGFHGIIL